MTKGPIISPRDLAYAGHAWIALVICAIELFDSIRMPLEWAQGIGMLVGIPLVLTALATGLVVLLLSVLEWKEWPLLVMSAAFASLLFAFIAAEDWNLVRYDVMRAWFAAYTALSLVLCARWFAFARWRQSSKIS